MLQSTGWPRARQDLATEEQQQCRITAGTKEVLKGECTSFLLSLSLSLCVSTRLAQDSRSLCAPLSFPMGERDHVPIVTSVQGLA